MHRKFCEMAIGYGLPRLDAIKLSTYQTNRLLSLPVLTERDLAEAENQIFSVCHTMALPMRKSPAPPNCSPTLPMLPLHSHGHSSSLRSSAGGPAHRPPRLQRRDLDVLDSLSVVGLIQSLATPDFLRAHSFHGEPAQIARYVNKVNTSRAVAVMQFYEV